MVSKTTKANLIVYLLIIILYFITMHVQKLVNQYDNVDELDLLETDPQITFNNFISAVESETEWNVNITSGKRTPEQQAELKRQNPKNASAYNSKHVYGLAIDINLYSTYTLQYIRKADTKATWLSTGVPEIAKRFGLKWGGDFKTYHDPVHFEFAGL
jgi:hypothetical protein